MQTPWMQPLQDVPEVAAVRKDIDDALGDTNELIAHGYGQGVGTINALQAQYGLIINEAMTKLQREVGQIKAQATRFRKTIAAKAASVPSVPGPEPQIGLPGSGDNPCACAFPPGYPPAECQGEYGFIVQCDPILGIPTNCKPWNDPIPPDDLPRGWCYYPGIPKPEPCPPGFVLDPATGKCILPPPPPPPPPPPNNPAPCPCVSISCPPPIVNCESKCYMPDTINVHIIPDCTPKVTFGCCVDTVIEDCVAREILPPIQCAPDEPVSVCVWPKQCTEVQFTCNVPFSIGGPGAIPSMDSECGQLLFEQSAAKWNPWYKYAMHGDPRGMLSDAGRMGESSAPKVPGAALFDHIDYLLSNP